VCFNNAAAEYSVNAALSMDRCLLCRWLNRKDSRGKYLFHAGFLGMDNVSCVDRSNLPSGCTTIDQVLCLCYNSVVLLISRSVVWLYRQTPDFLQYSHIMYSVLLMELNVIDIDMTNRPL